MEDFVAYASIILDVAVDQVLDYGVTAHQYSHLLPGTRVKVPLRGHLREGYVLTIKEQPNYPSVKPIAQILSEVPLISS